MRLSWIFWNFSLLFAYFDAKSTEYLWYSQCKIPKMWKNFQEIVRNVTLEFYAPVSFNWIEHFVRQCMCGVWCSHDCWQHFRSLSSIFLGLFTFVMTFSIVCCCDMCVWMCVFFLYFFFICYSAAYTNNKSNIRKKHHWQHVVNSINAFCVCFFLNKKKTKIKIQDCFLFFFIHFYAFQSKYRTILTILFCLLTKWPSTKTIK